MECSMFIGKYQPFHRGHKTLIDSVLKEGKNVVLAIRDTSLSEKDPYTVEQRIGMIQDIYPDAVVYPMQGRIMIVAIPDVLEVCYGRQVGWGIRQIKLNEEIENISATKIGAQMKLESE